jgi:RNA recognition motif-containing protein
LYVGNLAYEVSEKELNKSFAEYGELISARVIKNRFSGKSKGFGFVEIAGREEANAAVRALNGKDFKGRRIVVNEARSHSRE